MDQKYKRTYIVSSKESNSPMACALVIKEVDYFVWKENKEKYKLFAQKSGFFSF
jgi:hypothetical protein